MYAGEIMKRIITGVWNRLISNRRRECQPGASVPAPAAEPTFQFEPELFDAQLSGWFKNDNGELIEGFPIQAEDDVLDVGCGDGAFISFCANQGAKVMFADIDAAKIAEATRRLEGTPAREIVPLVSDADPLPLPDGAANKIVAMEVIEHVDSPERFLAELVRVGRPGALYLLTVPDPLAETVQKDLAPESYFQKPNHIRIIQRDEFEKMVQDAGLIIEKRTSYGFYWSIWWCFFWACDQDFGPPWHPLLKSWNTTWGHLLATRQGPKVKQALDKFMPKSQAIIARKP